MTAHSTTHSRPPGLNEIMRQQELDQKWDEVARQKAAAARAGLPPEPACMCARQEYAPPRWSPGDEALWWRGGPILAGPYSQLPKSVLTVYLDPELSDQLCYFCRTWLNVEYGGRSGKKIVSAFCRSCRSRLSSSPRMACSCGRPRFVDELGKPSQVCSTCHRDHR